MKKIALLILALAVPTFVLADGSTTGSSAPSATAGPKHHKHHKKGGKKDEKKTERKADKKPAAVTPVDAPAGSAQ